MGEQSFGLPLGIVHELRRVRLRRGEKLAVLIPAGFLHRDADDDFDAAGQLAGQVASAFGLDQGDVVVCEGVDDLVVVDADVQCAPEVTAGDA